MVNRFNCVLSTEEYRGLSEEEKSKWWKKDYPEFRNAIKQYNERMETEKREKYEEKKLQKVKQTNRLSAFTTQAAAYGGPISTLKIENGFFEETISKVTSEELARILSIECSILRILHPTDQVLFRTKKLNKSTRKQEPINPMQIITNLKEYFMSAPTTGVTATGELLAYFNGQNMEVD